MCLLTLHVYARPHLFILYITVSKEQSYTELKHRNKKSLLTKQVIVGNSYLVVYILWSLC